MGEAVEALCRKLLPAKPGAYLLGLSGGADSVALLLMLLPAFREGRIRLEAVHVNHGLRGAESDGDEQFCDALCRKEGVPLHIRHAELSGRRDEAAAREARFALFRTVYAETGADALILAHHADDQAETFLMRLLRGAGPDGLSCMKEDQYTGGMHILRPMLSLRREEIRNALREDGIPWREDSSNRDSAYLRNRIRMELLPAMETLSGSCTGRICRTARLIGADNEALDTEAEAILRQAGRGRMLDAERLAEESAALRSRVLRMWWREQGPALKEHTLSVGQTEAADRLLFVPRGKINLPGGMHAVRDGKYLFLTGGPYIEPEPVTVTGPDTVFGDFHLTEHASAGEPGDGKRSQEVPQGFTRGCVIRTRRPGDRIHPFGSSGSRKLQDYLTDRHVPEPFRDRIPLLCRGGEVLLAGGVGAGNIPDWKEQDAPVRLTWHGDMPWMES